MKEGQQFRNTASKKEYLKQQDCQLEGNQRNQRRQQQQASDGNRDTDVNSNTDSTNSISSNIGRDANPLA
jgi:hypothetical protein